MEKNKIIIVGDWEYEIYESALANGFRSSNWIVYPYKIPILRDRKYLNFFLQLILKGKQFEKINKELIAKCIGVKPKILFIYRHAMIHRRTIQKIQNSCPGIKITIYHNDNPYIGLKNKFKWIHYLKSHKSADITFVYRPKNIQDAKKWGAKRAELLLPHYVSYIHYPDRSKIGNNELIDVVFIGHYEKDGRAETINFLLENGIDVRIFGTGWEKTKKKNELVKHRAIIPLDGDDYRKTITRSKIALVFLSKKNQDVWTRRCFEIPACGTLMMVPKTRELEGIYGNDEVVFYSTKEELLVQIRFYLGEEEIRKRIAKNGYMKCVGSGNCEKSRARELIYAIQNDNNLRKN